ncbi:MAG: plasmid pRiA4b ORF-3 family protein [Gemmatimonadales bacterium]
MTRSRIRFGEGRVFQVRVELDGISPPVWRRILVSGRASLHELHEVIQRAIGPDTDSGYRFEVDGVQYLDPADEPAPGQAASAVSLESLELHPGSRFLHRAEHHAEPWLHLVTLEQMVPRLVGQRLPVCIAGGRAAPPDDCTGPRDYHQLLVLLADPLDPRAAELRSWLPEHFDPDYADVTSINAELSRVPKHRPAA